MSPMTAHHGPRAAADRARGAASDAADSADQAADRVTRSPGFRTAARAGFVMNGLVHILIGWIALQIALGGSGGGSADQSGALGSIARAPGGAVVLAVGAVAMIALALWCAVDAWVEARTQTEARKKASKAVSAAGKGVAFAAVGVLAAKFALGGGGSSSAQSSGAASTALATPGGQILVIVVGLVIVGIGVYHVYKGVSRKFEDDLAAPHGGSVGKAVVVTGVIGFVAKGLALIAVGGLLGWAGVMVDPKDATGLDGGLRAIAGLPFGTVLLALVGIGLVVYGLFSFLRARYQRL